MVQREVIMVEAQDLLEQILEEEVVVRRTFAMLSVRNFLLPEVEVAGLHIVRQAVAMVGTLQEALVLAVMIYTYILLEEMVGLKPQVVLMVTAVVFVQ